VDRRNLATTGIDSTILETHRPFWTWLLNPPLHPPYTIYFLFEELSSIFTTIKKHG